MAPRSQARGASPESNYDSFDKKAVVIEPAFSTSIDKAFNVFGSASEIPRPPKSAPPFSVAQVRAAIPKHCFQRSGLISGLHLLKDLTVIACLGYAATYIQFAHPFAQPLLWAAYWAAQGCTMGGVWIIAHECGHQAFSESRFVNDSVGW